MDGKQIINIILGLVLVKYLSEVVILDHKCWNRVIEGGSGDKTTVNNYIILF